jgi:outer membrane protein TolC
MKNSPRLARLAPALAATLACATVSAPAMAMQPLSSFLESAKTKSFDAREADAVLDQRESEASAGVRKLWPTLSARGVYTHNQYEAVVRVPNAGEAVITPQNQLDAFFSLDLPIIDFSAWARASSANTLRDAAAHRKDATAQDVELDVTRAYFQVLAARSVEEAARKSVEVAERSHKVIADRRSAGLATDLDLQRAVGEMERNRQRLANAAYLVKVDERALRTLSGLPPEAGGNVPADDLHAEPTPPSGQAEAPAVLAARAEADALDKTAAAQWRTLLPSLSANATERLTNATGFTNRYASYALSATLSWKLDGSTLAQSAAQDAAARVGAVRQERATQLQNDRVQNAWDLVQASIVSCRAARAEAEAAKLAFNIATDRYTAGTVLQLEVLDASRQAFQAEVTRIQADADLAIARQSLRVLLSNARTKP